MSGWALQHHVHVLADVAPLVVSMPSMSGWALRLSGADVGPHAGGVSMPSVSGWALRRHRQRLLRMPAVFLCPRCRAGLCDRVSGSNPPALTFLCPRCRAGLCDVFSIEGYSQMLFLCPRCRAGLCDGCLPWVAVTWAFGVRCAILAGTAPAGKGFRACSAKPAADQGVSVRPPRSFRAVRQQTVPAHVMIQKS
jgi:hypothetical protein